MLRVSSLGSTSLAALAALVASAALAVGCAHETAAARHESDLRDGLSRIQSETDRLHLQGDDDAPLDAPRARGAPAVFAASDVYLVSREPPLSCLAIDAPRVSTPSPPSRRAGGNGHGDVRDGSVP